MLSKENIHDIYGLSPMQQSMLINYAVNPESTAYVEQFDFKIYGMLDAHCMEQAFTQLVQRHDVLRTVFSYRKTELPRQVVLKFRDVAIGYEDMREVEFKDDAVNRLKEDNRKKGFDLSKDMLIRLALLHIENEEWRLILTFHHIVLDGWSISMLLQDLIGLYEGAATTRGHVTLPSPQPFSSYIRWLEQQNKEDAEQYWKQYLSGYEKIASLPAFEQATSYEHATHRFHLSKRLSEAIKSLASAHHWTVSTVFHAAWGLLLQKYNYANDVVFGSVVSGRPPQVSGIETMVGLFINTQPVRVISGQSDHFVALCNNVQQASFHAIQYEHFPLFEINSLSPLKNKLLDHVIAFENYPLSERLQNMGSKSEQSLRIDVMEVYEQTNYDFNVIINPGDEFVLTFIYNKNRYTQGQIEEFERSLSALLAEACANPETAVSQLSICSDIDQARIMHEFNSRRCDYMSHYTIPQLFSVMDNRFAEKEVLIWDDKAITYKQLDEWSDQLALHMKENGVSANDMVGIYMPRSPEMVAAILAVLKNGAVYVPLDYANSAERLAFIINDAAIRFVCVLPNQTSKLPSEVECMNVGKFEQEAPSVKTPILSNAATEGEATMPACIMYTSGSTGQPKGCLITHRNIISLIQGPDYINFGPSQVILTACSISFDPSLFEIFGALLHGGRLVLADTQDILDADRLEALLVSHNVSSILLTTALFNQLCDKRPTLFRSLETLLIGGEVASPKHVRKAKEANPALTIANCYGPTENTTISTFHVISEADYKLDRIPIGRPLVNSTAYVMDKSKRLLPIGAVGELGVGGEGVCLGYHKRNELTDERFVDNPYAPGEKLYLTGDLVRWLPDGTLDYIGRVDSQVKVRGYRIELGEIEAAMAELPSLEEAKALIRTIGQEKQLCAYYISSDEPDLKQWRRLLSTKIPEYMVPSFFIRINTFPLTVNGKVDIAALPLPEAKKHEAIQSMNATEKTIADIITSVLGLVEVDIHDNFFEIGINSLNMISIHNQVKVAFEKDIPLSVMFQQTSIARLAQYLQASGEVDTYAEQDEDMANARDTLLRTRMFIQDVEEAL